MLFYNTTNEISDSASLERFYVDVKSKINFFIILSRLDLQFFQMFFDRSHLHQTVGWCDISLTSPSPPLPLILKLFCAFTLFSKITFSPLYSNKLIFTPFFTTFTAANFALLTGRGKGSHSRGPDPSMTHIIFYDGFSVGGSVKPPVVSHTCGCTF